MKMEIIIYTPTAAWGEASADDIGNVYAGNPSSRKH